MKNETLRVGAGTVLPATKTVNQKTGKIFRPSTRPAPARPHRSHPAPVPPPAVPLVAFNLQLVRPARPDGTAAVHRCVYFEPCDAPPAVGLVVARLEPGQPYELWINGVLRMSEEGHGWQDRPRVQLVFTGMCPVGWCAGVGVVSVHHPAPESGGYLYLPTVPGQTLEARCDGRLLFAEPAAEKKGGADQ